MKAAGRGECGSELTVKVIQFHFFPPSRLWPTNPICVGSQKGDVVHGLVTGDLFRRPEEPTSPNCCKETGWSSTKLVLVLL